MFGTGQAGAELPVWLRLPVLWAQVIPVHTAEGHRSSMDLQSHTEKRITGSGSCHRHTTPTLLHPKEMLNYEMENNSCHTFCYPFVQNSFYFISPFFIHSKFIYDRNTTSWAMPSWNILITKSPWNNCKDFEARCNKTSSECFQVVSTFVREDK